MDDLAIDHGGALAVAAAEVEADAAALPAAAHLVLGLIGGGKLALGAGLDGEGGAEDRLAHDVGIEGVRAAGAVVGREACRRLGAAGDPDIATALLPQQILECALDVAVGGLGRLRAPGEDLELIVVNNAVGASQCNLHLAACGVFRHQFTVGTRPKRRRAETGIIGYRARGYRGLFELRNQLIHGANPYRSGSEKQE